VQRTAIEHKMKKVFGFFTKAIAYGSYAIAIINVLKFAKSEFERLNKKEGQYSDELQTTKKD